MQFYEFYCPTCGVQMVGPETKEKHMETCDGNFKGLLLPRYSPRGESNESKV